MRFQVTERFFDKRTFYENTIVEVDSKEIDPQNKGITNISMDELERLAASGQVKRLLPVDDEAKEFKENWEEERAAAAAEAEAEAPTQGGADASSPAKPKNPKKGKAKKGNKPAQQPAASVPAAE